MFLTLIVTLTVAAVEGLPQLVLQEPQHLVQYLPIIQAPLKRSFDVRNPNLSVQKILVYEVNDESDFFNRDVSPIHRRPGGNARLTAEPNNVKGAFIKSEIVNKEVDRATFARAEDSYTGQHRNVRVRNGFKSDGMPLIKVPIERRVGNNHKSDDIVSQNTRLVQKTDDSTFKPITMPKRSFSSNADSKQDNTVTFLNTNNRNQSIFRNTPQKTVPLPKNLDTSHNLIRTNMTLQDENKDSDLDSIKDLNRTYTQQITTDVNLEPIGNGKDGKRPVYVENSTETAANSNRPEGRVVPVNPNGPRSGLDSPVNDEEDRWIWSSTEKVETTTPDIENRVSFDGGSCPTGQVKVVGMCVYPDKDKKS